MTLIVEDGTAVAGAESYISVAETDARMSSRGFSSWGALSTPDKEAALRRATDYMLGQYRERWGGTRTTTTQALDWPRFLVPRKDVPGGYRAGPSYYLPNVVPVEVKNACADLAYKAISGELAPDLAPPVLSESLGPLSTTYAMGARQTVKYRAIDNMLALLLNDGGSGSTIKMVRS